MNLAFGFNILILTGVEASILAKKNQKIAKDIYLVQE
jgi:hypothetical protein